MRQPSSRIEGTNVYHVVMTEKKTMVTALCLDCNISTTAKTIGKAKADIVQLIGLQVRFARIHNMQEVLANKAASRDWKAFYRCREHFHEKHFFASSVENDSSPLFHFFVQIGIIRQNSLKATFRTFNGYFSEITGRCFKICSALYQSIMTTIKRPIDCA